MIAPMKRALFLAAVLVAAIATTAVGQSDPASADTTLLEEVLYDYDKRLRYTVLVDPFAIYSRTYGFGIAARFTAYNFIWAGSRWSAYARPSQRRGIYQLSLRTHDPSESDVYGLLHGTFETNSAYRYHGIGQSTLLDNLVVIDKDYWEGVARIGFDFMDDHLTIQPFAGYLWTKAGVGETIDSTFLALDEKSQRALLYAIGEPVPGVDAPSDVQQGVRFGLDVALDYRDRRAYPLSGYLLQAGWERYQSVNDLDVVFDQFDARLHAFFRISGSHVLAFRGLMQSTVDRGNDPVPFYLYPKLDFTKLGGYRNQRHIDLDLLDFTLEYRWPMINLVDLYQASAFAQAGVGAVYDDVFSDFEFDLTFAKDLPEGSNALRPGFGLGLRVSGLDSQVDYIQWMVGFSPEGFTLTAFYFVKEIGDIR